MRVYGLGCSIQSLCRDDQSAILGLKRLDGCEKAYLCKHKAPEARSKKH